MTLPQAAETARWGTRQAQQEARPWQNGPLRGEGTEAGSSAPMGLTPDVMRPPPEQGSRCGLVPLLAAS